MNSDTLRIRFEISAKVCADNASALLEDARLLREMDRHGTATALAILAQEEFAKAYLLNLVSASVLPWCAPVQKALLDHLSKQVLTVIMEWLAPSFEQQMARMRRHIDGGSPEPVPSDVVNALNILRHELIEKLRAPNRYFHDRDAEREWTGLARKLARRQRERLKHVGLYVTISADGTAKRSNLTYADADRELERARLIKDAAGIIISFGEQELVRRHLRTLFLDIELDEARRALAPLQGAGEKSATQDLASARVRVEVAEKLWTSLISSAG